MSKKMRGKERRKATKLIDYTIYVCINVQTKKTTINEKERNEKK